MAKDRRIFGGFSVVIENPVGSVREWKDAAGKSGATTLKNDYGYIEDTDSPEGDGLDCYLGPDEAARFVYVVHQLRYDGAYDEDKVLLGFKSEADAKAAFLAHRDDGERAYGGMSSIPVDRFRAKLARREGDGKIRHEAMMANAVQMRIEQRGDEWVVLPESGDRVLGTHKTKADAEKQLAAIEANKARMTAFDIQLGADGRVRAGVWDRVCVPGADEKDGQSTEFTAATLSEMAVNFETRGDPIPIDANHQSNYSKDNGQPAPALGFYAALAVVFDEKIIKLAHAKGCQAMGGEPGIDLSKPGLWAYRSEVTPYGQQQLPNFKFLSPTFTPAGVTRDGAPIGYHLMAVAATNTPWQSGTEITMAIPAGGPTRWSDQDIAGELEMARASSDAGLRRVLDHYPELDDEPAIRMWEAARREGARRGLRMDSAGATGNGNGAGGAPSGGSTMAKLSKLAKFAGTDEDADDKKIKQGILTRMDDEAKGAKKAFEEDDEGFSFAKHAEGLEEAARAYEDAQYEDEDEDEPPHVVMRKMAAKMRRMAKLSEQAVPDHAEPDGDEVAKEAALALAQRLGIPVARTLSSAQMFDAIKASAVPVSQIPTLVEAQVTQALAAREAKAARDATRTKAEKLVTMAVAGGYPKAQADSLLKAASDPAQFDAIYEMATPFLRTAAAQNPALFEQTTFAGTPLGGDSRRASLGSGPDRKIIRNELATFVEEGGRFSAMAIEMAESKDPAIVKKLDALLSENERDHAGLRLIAANRILKAERPDLWDAAEDPVMLSSV